MTDYDTMDQEEAISEGFSSQDEMCFLSLGYMTPYKLEEVGTVFSVAVHDAVLNPSYCGLIRLNSWEETQSEALSKYVYNNTLNLHSSSNAGLTVMDDTTSFCHALVFDAATLISNNLIWRIDIPFITLYPAIGLLFLILCCIQWIDHIVSKLKPGDYAKFENEIEHRRKINVYLFSILFYSFLLFILLDSVLDFAGGSNSGSTMYVHVFASLFYDI